MCIMASSYIELHDNHIDPHNDHHGDQLYPWDPLQIQYYCQFCCIQFHCKTGTLIIGGSSATFILLVLLYAFYELTQKGVTGIFGGCVFVILLWIFCTVCLLFALKRDQPSYLIPMMVWTIIKIIAFSTMLLIIFSISFLHTKKSDRLGVNVSVLVLLMLFFMMYIAGQVAAFRILFKYNAFLKDKLLYEAHMQLYGPRNSVTDMNYNQQRQGATQFYYQNGYAYEQAANIGIKNLNHQDMRL